MLARPMTSALVAATTLLAAGCGGDAREEDAAPTPSRTEHNAADVAFATGMIPHHAGAGRMVDLTRGRPLDPAVETLAERIMTVQVPETETMVDWLAEWGEPIPETIRDHVNSHGGHGGAASDEMKDMAEDVEELEQASDAEFQERFLELMIEHHEDAVDMAEEHLAEGQYLPARRLATQIRRTQQREIATMEKLLAG
ncbi:DUF305 domain-containing protein [Nocardioides guangzhouensis]|nr:DUF305 domain-containing protein [Nocardioides guangzhouensis]